MGVRGKPIGIDLDGENLLSLSVGQYTFLDLKPGKYDMVVTSWTLESSDNAMVETSRYFVLDVAGADSVYLLFTLEKINFWEILGHKVAEGVRSVAQKASEQVFPDTLQLQIGKHVSVQLSSHVEPQLSSESKPQPGIGYTVESVSRETAIEAASKLEPVEGAQKAPLHKTL